MKLTKETKLKDILAAYPWLIDEAVKLDGRFKALRSPLGRLLIARADIAEASRRTGIGAQEIIDNSEARIRKHQT